MLVLKDDLNEELYNKVYNLINEIEVFSILNGKYDALNCYIEIKSGAGGTEACDWASMLYEMYISFFEKENYKYEVIDYNKAEEAGIKNALIKVSFINAYGYLKHEMGVHRLVRISPFDAGSRRHTSFASVTIIPEFNEEINVEIKETDLKIDTYHSSGAGGQSVNTTNSAVRIKHLPTGIVVTCQNERSQIKNKDIALKILRNKLHQLEIEKQEKTKDSLTVKSSIDFGSQIRSYVLEPYKLVKDNRSLYESTNPNKILSGEIKEMLEFNIRNIKNE